MASRKSKVDIDNSAECLVFGYIRKLEEVISNQIIPLSIIELCIKFFLSKAKIAYMSLQTKKYSNYPQIIITDFDTNKHFECNINSIEMDLFDIAGTYKGIGAKGGLCYISNFKLPSNMYLIYKQFNSRNIYDIIFKLGYDTYSFESYIIDTNQFKTDFNNNNINNKTTKINAHFYRFVPPPIAGIGSFGIYSRKYGLIQIGNPGGCVFNVFNFDTLKWRKIKPSLKNRDLLQQL